ncbi:MAG: elongation factor Ts [Muribaculaceae bacterium]|nr:elongation factor Ts [Muribaculaceae bacterium]MBR5118092.1 elongation factor Ts [Muribaculaceae bacterium]
MAVSINDIKKLREITNAGMVDCKKALIEAENDMDKAVEIIRKRGQAIAAKRGDRTAAEGIAKCKVVGNFGAIVALKCETEPVAGTEKFVTLANRILDEAVAAKVQNLDDLKNYTFDGATVAEHITALSGITGEKMELGAYECLEAAGIAGYNHFNKKLSTLVAFNAPVDEETGKAVAMQVAAMRPVAASREQIPQNVIDEETGIAIEKTKSEQVQKAVENALKKAGFNPYYCATEEHQDEAVRKGYMTPEQVEQAKQLMADTADAKLKSMPEQMIQNIVKGRMEKFYKENILMEQEYEASEEKGMTIAMFLDKAQKGLVATDLKRVNLNAD